MLHGKAFKTFSSAVTVGNPNINKPLGTNRMFRLNFPCILAPRECFTEEDHTVPIHEISLPNGATAFVIHNWTKLNQTIPPSQAGIWGKRRPSAPRGTGRNNGKPIQPQDKPQAATTTQRTRDSQ